ASGPDAAREAPPSERQHHARRLGQRMLGAVDLAIDFATLGEYGLEPLPAEGLCRERSGHDAGREARAAARLRGCDAGASAPRRIRIR
ncbi:MAG TPA: hypothetical protein VHG51_13885, partial [Longimicrobiaceae bacterium]|nr:hypothetical protein [Longimicrobiaceae bacterium]